MIARILRTTLMGCAILVFGVALLPSARAEDPPERPPRIPYTQKWMENGAPGLEHELLRGFEGEWLRRAKWRTGFNGQWQLDVASSKNEMVLGGRFMKQQIEVKDGDKVEVQAIVYLGYDKISKQFVESRMNNSSDSIASTVASYDPSKRTFNFKRTRIDADKGRIVPYRTELTIYHDDGYGEVIYELDEKGQEYVTKEVQYTRKVGTAEAMRQKQQPNP